MACRLRLQDGRTRTPFRSNKHLKWVRNESECKEEVLHLPLNLTDEINVLSGKSLVKHDIVNPHQSVGREVRPTQNKMTPQNRASH